jgi:hypothetical protein
LELRRPEHYLVRDIQADEPNIVEYIRRLWWCYPPGTTRVFLDLVPLDTYLSMAN